MHPHRSFPGREPLPCDFFCHRIAAGVSLPARRPCPHSRAPAAAVAGAPAWPKYPRDLEHSRVPPALPASGLLLERPAPVSRLLPPPALPVRLARLCRHAARPRAAPATNLRRWSARIMRDLSLPVPLPTVGADTSARGARNLLQGARESPVLLES